MPRIGVPSPPEGWYELAFDPVDRVRSLGGQWPPVRGRLGGRATPAVEAAFAEVLAGLADAYAADGALWAAVRWRPETGEPPYAVAELRTAGRLTDGDAEREADALVAMLGTALGSDLGVREVDRVALPSGPGVRLRVLGAGGAADGRVFVGDLAQWWLPAANLDRTVVLAASCADLTDGDEVAAALDGMAAGLRIRSYG